MSVEDRPPICAAVSPLSWSVLSERTWVASSAATAVEVSLLNWVEVRLEICVVPNSLISSALSLPI